MTAATAFSSAELSKHLVDVEERLLVAQAKLPAALRNAATAFLDGREDDESKSVRAEIRALKDLLAGLIDLSVRISVDELDAEINRRERAYEAETKRLARARQDATRQDAVFEGTGPELIRQEREDREARNKVFTIYEQAYLAHLDERKAIDALISRRAELERKYPDAFDD